MKGHKRVLRTVKFQDQDLAEGELEKSKFIEKFYSWLKSELPKRFKSGNIKKDVEEGAKMIEDYLKRNKNNAKIYNKFVGEMYNFIAAKGVTHYVYSIMLGAAIYHKTTKTIDEMSAEGGAGIGLPKGADFEAKINFMNKKGMIEKTERRIGEMDADHRVLKEAVIKYNSRPVYTLINRRFEATRKAFEKAIRSYIGKESKLYNCVLLFKFNSSSLQYLFCYAFQYKVIKVSLHYLAKTILAL